MKKVKTNLLKIVIFSLLLTYLISHILCCQQILIGKVIAVIDGDTIRILTQNKQNIKIRLACIDSPEKKQAFGKKAKYSLSRMIFGKQVKIITQGKGIHGRIIGTIYYNNEDINLKQVKQGYAWVYRKYCKEEKYYEAEKEARSKKLGLWSEPNPIPPWEWRKIRRNLRKSNKG